MYDEQQEYLRNCHRCGSSHRRRLEGPLDHVKRGSDVLEGYKDAAEQSDEADAAAKKAERGTGRGSESQSDQKVRALRKTG